MKRLLCTSLLLAAACSPADATPQAKEFDGDRALKRVSEQVKFGPRVPGTTAHANMAKWLDSLSRTLADTVIVQHWWHTTASGDTIPMYNVMARFKPELKERVLYLAHWDTRPRGDAGGSKLPIAGANDGGSGVAVLLGVAEALKKLPPGVGVDLLFVDGEDFGEFNPTQVDVLIGSTYYAANPIVKEKPKFAILFDMVGQKNLRLPIEQNSQIAAPDIVEMVWGVAEAMGYGGTFVRTPGGQITDDHVPLISAGYKVIDLIPNISDYAAWHTLDDNIDKVFATTLATVGNVAVAVIRHASK